MTEEYLIMERKDLGKDSVVAIPKSAYHQGVNEIFDEAGGLKGLMPADFQKHDHWSFCYIPIKPIGSIQEPSKNAVRKGIEAVCEAQGSHFDKERLLRNEEIATKILDYEVVEGDIHIIRFSGENIRQNEGIILSAAYFLAPQDGELSLDGNQVLIDEKLAHRLDKDLRFMFTSTAYEGDFETFKAGSVKLHRKNLKPYSSTGRYGSPHHNGPWIVLEDDVSQEKLDSISRYMNSE